MTEARRRTVPLRSEPAAPGRPSAEALARLDRRWRPRYLMLAPHRLGFFLAMLLLMASGLWWALVQIDRVSGALALPYGVAPSLVHAAVMTFGFMPLFFAGFLFTAGPKWLHVEPWPVSRVMPPLLLQAGGWLVWLAGGSWGLLAALAGCAVAFLGLGWMTVLFIRLVQRSTLQDRLHARAIAAACLVGCVCIAALGLSLAGGRGDLARAWVLTGLWGFVAAVFVVVAHRMIPFFTSAVLPMVQAWRPFWVLWLMLAAVVAEALAVWLPWLGWAPALDTGGLLVRGALELSVGAVLLWLAYRWGLLQSLAQRLLAMLHIGFIWLGLAFVGHGLAHGVQGLYGSAAGELGALHALTMGCLGSLMLAMVTRVSCGHGGRALVADRLVWTLFWVLQLATVVRLAASAPLPWSPVLLAVAALLWAGIMAVWGLRLIGWYGRLRADGRPG